MGKMPVQTPLSDLKVIALLNRYRCPMPLHAVRAYFMGSIATPGLTRSPMDATRELWGGELPVFDSTEDLNYLIRVLISGLWNKLAAHQTPGNPFKLTPMRIKPTRQSLQKYALLRLEEVDGFRNGLFGPHEELDLPEAADKALDGIREMRPMLKSMITLLDESAASPSPAALKGLSDNLPLLSTILETEINTVIISCTLARKQSL